MRRHDEPVQVRLRTIGDEAQGVPDAFLWRGRLYVVREVLATWLESEPWWEAARTPGHRVAPERTVWRVEAGAGRQLGTGVYDLAQAVAAPAMAGAGAPGGTPAGAGGSDEWWLLCQLD
ncbi:DUF6504 family protein [Jannaschia sp. R86511]|uniref:DUF6504 family protein n=1 Tax=Jannaschia sp. R86511 TaxID=3093853 RepID=UPI0036D219AC